MSATSEKDYLLAISVAKLLGVELDPWQERLLQEMLAAHREPASATFVRCNAVWDSGGPEHMVRCICSADHVGRHKSSVTFWSSG